MRQLPTLVFELAAMERFYKFKKDHERLQR